MIKTIKGLTTICLIGLVACHNGEKMKEEPTQEQSAKKNICGNYAISTSPSELIVSHYESTETLGTTVDSGTVNINPEIIKQIEEKKEAACHSATELKLTGDPKIEETLFGNENNYGDLWQNQYLIKGAVVGIYKYGLEFRVDSYTLIGKKNKK